MQQMSPIAGLVDLNPSKLLLVPMLLIPAIPANVHHGSSDAEVYILLRTDHGLPPYAHHRHRSDNLNM